MSKYQTAEVTIKSTCDPRDDGVIELDEYDYVLIEFPGQNSTNVRVFGDGTIELLAPAHGVVSVSNNLS